MRIEIDMGEEPATLQSLLDRVVEGGGDPKEVRLYVDGQHLCCLPDVYLTDHKVVPEPPLPPSPGKYDRDRDAYWIGDRWVPSEEWEAAERALGF